MEGEFIEEIPQEGADDRHDGDAHECAEELGCKEVEHHGADERQSCEGEI